MAEFHAPIRGRLPRAPMGLFHRRVKLDMPMRIQFTVSPLVRFSAMATWVEKTLEQQDVPFQG